MWSAVMPDHATDSRLSHICWRDLLSVHATRTSYSPTCHPVISPTHEAVISLTRASHYFAPPPRLKSWTYRSRAAADTSSLIGCWDPIQNPFIVWATAAFSEAPCDFIAMPTGCEVDRHLTVTSDEWRTWCPGTGKLEGTGSQWWPIEKSEGIC